PTDELAGTDVALPRGDVVGVQQDVGVDELVHHRACVSSRDSVASPIRSPTPSRMSRSSSAHTPSYSTSTWVLSRSATSADTEVSCSAAKTLARRNSSSGSESVTLRFAM